MPTTQTSSAPRVLTAIAAAAGPTLLAYNLSPSPTFLNQALALAMWGWFVVFALPPAGGWARGAGPLFAALALLIAAVCGSFWPGTLPMGLALSAIGCLLAAGVMVAGGSGTHSLPEPGRVFGDFCVGWAVAGAGCVVVALIQVFWTALPDGDWIAVSGIPGRAVGNMRQPNHLSSVLLWSSVAVVALAEMRRLRRGWAALLFAPMVFGVVLSASRTGFVGIVLLLLWGLLDRRLSRPTRWLLASGLVIYAAGWFAMDEWSHLTTHVFGGAERLAQHDISSSRFGIWGNTLAMIRRQPWMGVGFGEFNLAWTLTPFPGRPPEFFDNAHNLPLQLAAEIGLPLALVVLGLLGWALWHGARGAFGPGAEEGDAGVGRRAAMMMVAIIGLHSLLEYPLWYLYFLLPTAWAWGFAVGGAVPRAAAAARPSKGLAVCGVALAAGAVLSVADYIPETAIYNAEDGAPPLSQRIARGEHSVLFAHHADYAAATTEAGKPGLAPFKTAIHYLLDTRLMIDWSKALAAAGQTDKASYVAARLHEFGRPNADDFYDECENAASAPTAFQCRAPKKTYNWREFTGH